MFIFEWQSHVGVYSLSHMYGIYTLSYMHTYRIRDRGSRVRGDRGAAGADGASPAGVS